ncbi:hypothetical protein JCM11491_003980 [Sporobolomyces phaffii]
MAPTHNKVVYKPDSMSTEEYIIILQDVDAANKWIAGELTRVSSRCPFAQTGKAILPRTNPAPPSPVPRSLRSWLTKSVSRARSTIPLVDIVDSFDVFTTGQGAQGILERPSKQTLDTVFSTTNINDIVEIVLEKGRILSGNTPHKFGSKNDQRSGNYQVSAGSGASGHGGR